MGSIGYFQVVPPNHRHKRSLVIVTETHSAQAKPTIQRLYQCSICYKPMSKPNQPKRKV